MKTFFSSLKPQLLFVALSLFTFASVTNMACAPKFDQTAVDNVSNLSTLLPDMMSKATGTFDSNSAVIQKASDALDKAVAHANATKGNKAIATSWNTLKNDLVAPFLARWKEKGKLEGPFIKEATAQVVKSLDAIKNAEKGKKK